MMLGNPRRAITAMAALALFTVPLPAAEARDRAASSSSIGTRDPEAIKTLERMHAYLASQQAFNVTIDSGYDVVQPWGQKIEFGEQRVVTLRRPDHLRVDASDRDGTTSTLVFEANRVVFFDSKNNPFGTSARQGNLDQAIAYFTGELGMRLPMAGLLTTNVGDRASWAHTIRSVGTATINGVPCDHVALSGDWEDVQVWVAQGAQPLPQRMVITYKRAEGQPQYWGQMRNWILNAAIPDTTFQFTPPAGALQVPIVPLLRQAQPPAAASAAGGRP